MSLTETLNAINQTWMTSFENEDWETFVGGYTEDCSIMAANFPRMVGRQACQDFFSGAKAAMNIHHIVLRIDELYMETNESCLDRGTVEFYNEAGELMDTSKYLVMWKHVGETWQIHIDMFSSNTAHESG